MYQVNIILEKLSLQGLSLQGASSPSIPDQVYILQISKFSGNEDLVTI